MQRLVMLQEEMLKGLASSSQCQSSWCRAPRTPKQPSLIANMYYFCQGPIAITREGVEVNLSDRLFQELSGLKPPWLHWQRAPLEPLGARNHKRSRQKEQTVFTGNKTCKTQLACQDGDQQLSSKY